MNGPEDGYENGSGGEPNDLHESDPNGAGPDGLAGDLGVSSERVGKVRGSAEPATHGEESLATEPPADPPREQSPDPTTPEPHPNPPA